MSLLVTFSLFASEIITVSFFFTGMVTAIDINKGRLRILKESAKSHQVDHVVNAVHDDLRAFSVRISVSFVFL